jgi:CBS domain containing-hemolysin-like protein
MGAIPSPDSFVSLTEANLIWIACLTLGLIVSLILSAFYSGSETALVSVDKIKVNRLAEEDNKRAQIIGDFLKKPEKMLGLTLVGTNLANVVTAQLMLLLVVVLLEASATTQKQVATSVTTVLLLIFGELLPKTIFRVKADALTLRYAYPLRISEFILGFIVNVVTYFTDFLVKIIGKNTESTSPDARRDELRLLATMGEQSGELLRDQRRMIHSVLDLQSQTIEQVMVPLVDIVAVKKNTDIETFLRTASDSGFSRIPVYEGQIYNIVGIVHLLDVIYANGDARTIQRFIRTDLHVVPESKNTSVLLKEVQRSRHTMVFVVDEYGGVVGLVTVEDLVEEIVGEFSYELDEGAHIRLVSPRILECEGRAEVSILHDQFGAPIPLGDYETIAGFILEQTSTIPRPGDEIETDDLIIVISDADARSIRRVRIRNKCGSFITREM